MKPTRRKFLKTGLVSLAGITLAGKNVASGRSLRIETATPSAKKEPPDFDSEKPESPPGAALSGSSASVIAENAEQWRVVEINFTSERSYRDPFNDVDMDVFFSHIRGTGFPGRQHYVLKVPAFWNGGDRWVVRFAPILTGEWTYHTVCSEPSDKGLHDRKGEITVHKYGGDLAIYKHGFIRTRPTKRHFMHADGTPFFYLGDTHWNFPVNALPNLKKIIDKRVEQGFTVIQSQPKFTLGGGVFGVMGYDLSDGVSEKDIPYFVELDERFQYVADRGLVHAHTQLICVFELGPKRENYPDDYLEKLCRYWVARYCSYPVMWTTAQECDRAFYHYQMRGQNYYDATNNPWKLVAQYIHHYDPYHHPQTAHQENTGHTVASNSSFRDMAGHSWYAAQWAPRQNGQLDFDIPKDYWYNGQGKPVVNYEGRYDHLWTKHDGARMQGWTAYLNGMYGHGYGAADIWLYNSTYDMERDSHSQGITITIEDKKTKWQESLEFPSAYQMGHMHDFFKSIEWWRLVPRFDDLAWFRNNGSWYSLASDGNDLYVAYFYNPDLNTGTIRNLDNTTYAVQWYNPVNGEYGSSAEKTIRDGTFDIGNKPDTGDWVLLMKKK